jgi:LysM repeat protein
MKKANLAKLCLRAISLAIIFVMVLGVAAAVAPQRAQAATSCQATYTVKTGDTKNSIAQAYGVKWADIADANGFPKQKNPKKGDELCIPKTSTTNFTYTLIITGNRAFLTTSKGTIPSAYNIKVRPTLTGVGGWYNLGKLKQSDKASKTTVLSLPAGLRGVTPLSVCLKNQTTDELTCRSAPNP